MGPLASRLIKKKYVPVAQFTINDTNHRYYGTMALYPLPPVFLPYKHIGLYGTFKNNTTLRTSPCTDIDASTSVI